MVLSGRLDFPGVIPHDHFPSDGSAVLWVWGGAASRTRRFPRPVQSRGVPVRAASKTSVIAWLETAAAAWLSSSDWWLAPATTRWTPLSDSAASSVCGVSQLVWASTGAVIVFASGLSGGRQVGAYLARRLGGQLSITHTVDQLG